MPSTTETDDRELVESRFSSLIKLIRTRKIKSPKPANPLPRRRDCFAPERFPAGPSKHVAPRNGNESTSQKGKHKATSFSVSNPQKYQEKCESGTRKLEKTETREEVKDQVRFCPYSHKRFDIRKGIKIKFVEAPKHRADEVDAGALEMIRTGDKESITPSNIYCEDVVYASKSSNAARNQQPVACMKPLKASKLLIAALRMVLMPENGEISNQHAANPSKRKYENECDEFDNSQVKRVKKSEKEHDLIQTSSINPHMGTELIDDDMCDSEVSSIMALQGDYTILPYRLPISMVQNTFRPITSDPEEMDVINLNKSPSATSCVSKDETTSNSPAINDYNKQTALVMDDELDTVRSHKTSGSSAFSPIIINGVATPNPIAVDNGSQICPIVIDDDDNTANTTDYLQDNKLTDGLTNIPHNEVPHRVALKPTFVGVHMEFDGSRWRRRTSGK